MTLKTRLKKLEGVNSENKTVLVFIPREWDAEMSEEAFNRIVAENAIEGPFDRWIQPDNTFSEASLAFVGNIQDLIERIAKNSARIGDKPKD